MTSRERLMRAFKCEETDRMPVRLWGVDPVPDYAPLAEGHASDLAARFPEKTPHLEAGAQRLGADRFQKLTSPADFVINEWTSIAGLAVL